ncbi:MAG TPA: hypothetical protein VET90_08780, partial [Candidatus Binatus sp.]|nr:hypothetical protein [Candidatus Binatus sp.]
PAEASAPEGLPDETADPAASDGEVADADAAKEAAEEPVRAGGPGSLAGEEAGEVAAAEQDEAAQAD